MRVLAETVARLFESTGSPSEVAINVLLADEIMFIDELALTLNTREPPLGNVGMFIVNPNVAGQVAPPLAVHVMLSSVALSPITYAATGLSVEHRRVIQEGLRQRSMRGRARSAAKLMNKAGIGSGSLPIATP